MLFEEFNTYEGCQTEDWRDGTTAMELDVEEDED